MEFKIDFIGIGAPKTGTTWLAKCLSEHPEICFSKKKEINFFNKTYQFYHKNMPWNYARGIKWYQQFFSACKQGQINGEFSVNYLYDEKTPQLIKEHFPDTKIILILRNPVEQIYSNYLHVRSQYDIPSLNDMIKNKNSLIEYGLYSKYIKNYQTYFKPSQFLILLYNDLRKEPLNFLKKVYSFLNVNDNFIPPSMSKIINPTAPKTNLYSRLYFKLRNKIIKIIGKYIINRPKIKKIIMQKEKKFLRLFVYKFTNKRKKYKNLTIENRKKLMDILKEDINKLEKIIKKDLSTWKQL